MGVFNTNTWSFLRDVNFTMTLLPVKCSSLFIRIHSIGKMQQNFRTKITKILSKLPFVNIQPMSIWDEHLCTFIHVTVSLCLASSRPTLKQLQKTGIITSVATKWYELGIELLDDSQSNQLDIIKANHHCNVTNCCYDMFKYWLESHPTANWYKLVDALRESGIEENTVAAKLEKNFTA